MINRWLNLKFIPCIENNLKKSVFFFYPIVSDVKGTEAHCGHVET